MPDTNVKRINDDEEIAGISSGGYGRGARCAQNVRTGRQRFAASGARTVGCAMTATVACVAPGPARRRAGRTRGAAETSAWTMLWARGASARPDSSPTIRCTTSTRAAPRSLPGYPGASPRERSTGTEDVSRGNGSTHSPQEAMGTHLRLMRPAAVRGCLEGAVALLPVAGVSARAGMTMVRRRANERGGGRGSGCGDALHVWRRKAAPAALGPRPRPAAAHLRVVCSGCVCQSEGRRIDSVEELDCTHSRVQTLQCRGSTCGDTKPPTGLRTAALQSPTSGSAA
jgi:hypothetical protein